MYGDVCTSPSSTRKQKKREDIRSFTYSGKTRADCIGRLILGKPTRKFRESSFAHCEPSHPVDGAGWKPGSTRSEKTQQDLMGEGLSGFAFGIMLIKANEVMASCWYATPTQVPWFPAFWISRQCYGNGSSSSRTALFVLFQRLI